MKHPQFKAPWFLPSGHFQTIYPNLFRKVELKPYQRARINTSDGDFLDLDWSKIGSKRIVLISHGLEGNTDRHYVKGMVRTVNLAGWDALAYNFRGCSGEVNRLPRFYHSGVTGDLEQVVNHIVSKNHYNEIALIGFSMGGNQTLLYLAKHRDTLPEELTKSIVFSVPCSLEESSYMLAKPSSYIYMKRFLRSLKKKVVAKEQLFPNEISSAGYAQIKNFKDFDDRYTAPLHGFKNAQDYWAKCSSAPYIEQIEKPTLIINALNDPFLKGDCFPYKHVDKNPSVSLETPKNGGHVGFVPNSHSDLYWSERRAVAFLNNSPFRE